MDLETAASKLASEVVGFEDSEVGDYVIEDPGCCGAWISCSEGAMEIRE